MSKNYPYPNSSYIELTEDAIYVFLKGEYHESINISLYLEENDDVECVDDIISMLRLEYGIHFVLNNISTKSIFTHE